MKARALSHRGSRWPATAGQVDVGDTEADDRQQGKGKRNGFTRITLIYANQRCSDGDGMAALIRPTRPRPILKTGPSSESAVSSNKFIEFVHFGRWNFCWWMIDSGLCDLMIFGDGAIFCTAGE